MTTEPHTITSFWGAADPCGDSFLVTLGLDGRTEMFSFQFENTEMSRNMAVAFTRHAGNVVGGVSEDLGLPAGIKDTVLRDGSIHVEFNDSEAGLIHFLGDRVNWLRDSFLSVLPKDPDRYEGVG